VRAVRPEVRRLGDHVNVRWPDDYVTFEFSRWHTSRDGATIVELGVTTDAPGITPLLHFGMVNLHSTRAQADLAKVCRAGYPTGPDWPRIARESCLLALAERRQGRPVVNLATVLDESPRYAVDRLVPEDGETLWYGQEESLKSWLLLYCAGCISRGEPFLGIPVRQGRPLVVNYETSAAIMGHRLWMLARGAEWGTPPDVLHLEPDAPLTDIGDELAYACDREKVDIIFVDSIGFGGAASVEADVVMRAYRALHASRRPVVAIHHPPKWEAGDGRSPYGSVYHRYAARSIVEFRRTDEDEVAYVGMFPRKLSWGVKRAPFGAEVVFADGAAIIRPADPAKVPGLAQHVPLTVRVKDFLQRGARMPEEIAEALDADPDKLGSLLRKLKSAGKLSKLPDGRWGLSA
jgi:hypothetical protein